jgi:hypothetical protein
LPTTVLIATVLPSSTKTWDKTVVDRRRELAEAAYYNFFVAAIFSVPAIVTGLLGWQ